MKAATQLGLAQIIVSQRLLVYGSSSWSSVLGVRWNRSSDLCRQHLYDPGPVILGFTGEISRRVCGNPEVMVKGMVKGMGDSNEDGMWLVGKLHVAYDTHVTWHLYVINILHKLIRVINQRFSLFVRSYYAPSKNHLQTPQNNQLPPLR